LLVTATIPDGQFGDTHVNTSQKTIAAVLLTMTTILLAGCPPRVSIADINRDPGRYANKDISVGGRVSSSFGALGSGVFQIDDGTGTIWVYSQSYGVPANGAKVGVTGRISQGFSFGGRSFAVILRETERRH
jgi:hypothetical protein